MERKSDIEIYKTDDGQTQIEVTFEQDTVWLTDAQLVRSFNSCITNINEHIKHIFQSDDEIIEKVNSSEIPNSSKGRCWFGRKGLSHYNLDVIIAVGYRVNSKQGPCSANGHPND